MVHNFLSIKYTYKHTYLRHLPGPALNLYSTLIPPESQGAPGVKVVGLLQVRACLCQEQPRAPAEGKASK